MEKASSAEVSSTFSALEGQSSSLFHPEQTSPDRVAIPDYLERTYWWAYLHPMGVRFFERQWMVNLILWGNFSRLRDAVLNELGGRLEGRVLQVACVYGDFTPGVASRMTPECRFDVVDVARVQLENVSKKIKNFPNISLHLQDSTNLEFEDASFDHVVVFFLLHEQPQGVREKTVQEAIRVVKPGGKVIFADYHRPRLFNPFRYIMAPILMALEPFAMDMWRHEIADWIPKEITLKGLDKQEFFGGLYQKVVMTR